MKIVFNIIDKINRIRKIYEGTVYEVKDESKKILTKKNVEENTNIVIDKIYYKRPLFTNMYVKEISTGKKIPTFVKNKKIRLPLKKFVIVNNKGFKFDELEVRSENIDTSYNVTNEIDDLFGKTEKLRITNLSSKLKAIKKDSKIDYKMIGSKINEKKSSLFSKFKQFSFKKRKEEKVSLEEIVNEELVCNENSTETQKVINEPTIEEKIKLNVMDNNNPIEKDEKINNVTEVEKLEDTKIDIKKEIKSLEKIKQEILCDYWMTKQYPRKNIVKIETVDKDICKVADEMIKNTESNNIVKTYYNGIYLSTQVLKTRNEIIAYYQYKTENTKKELSDEVKENCYKMIRIDRKLNK